jgi:hypothetical protein
MVKVALGRLVGMSVRRGRGRMRMVRVMVRVVRRRMRRMVMRRRMARRRMRPLGWRRRTGTASQAQMMRTGHAGERGEDV